MTRLLQFPTANITNKYSLTFPSWSPWWMYKSISWKDGQADKSLSWLYFLQSSKDKRPHSPIIWKRSMMGTRYNRVKPRTMVCLLSLLNLLRGKLLTGRFRLIIIITITFPPPTQSTSFPTLHFHYHWHGCWLVHVHLPPWNHWHHHHYFQPLNINCYHSSQPACQFWLVINGQNASL